MRASLLGLGLIVVLLVVGMAPLAPEAGERRGRNSHGGKSVGIKENRLGGFDLYDKAGNRVGTARRSRIAPGTVEIFSTDGKRLGEIKSERGPRP